MSKPKKDEAKKPPNKTLLSSSLSRQQMKPKTAPLTLSPSTSLGNRLCVCFCHFCWENNKTCLIIGYHLRGGKYFVLGAEWQAKPSPDYHPAQSESSKNRSTSNKPPTKREVLQVSVSFSACCRSSRTKMIQLRLGDLAAMDGKMVGF